MTARKSLTAFGVALTLGLGSAGLSLGHDGHEHKHGTPLHGGKVAMTREYHFEVVFAKDGLRVFPRTHEDNPIDASRLTGTATFYHPNSPNKPWFERPLRGTGESLDLAIGLANAPRTGAKVTFRVVGLPGGDESVATFTEPLEFVAQPDAHPTVPGAVAPGPRYIYRPGYYGLGNYPTVPGAVAPGPRYIYRPGYYGLGNYRHAGPAIAPPYSVARPVPLSGYGRIPSAGPGYPMPYLSGGHAVSILP